MSPLYNKEKPNYPYFFAHPDGSPPQLIQICGVILHRFWATVMMETLGSVRRWLLAS